MGILLFDSDYGKWYTDERERYICAPCCNNVEQRFTTQKERQISAEANCPPAHLPQHTNQQSNNNIPPPTFTSLFYRLEFYISLLNIIGSITFNIGTAANSDYWDLNQAQKDGLIYFMLILTMIIYIISHYFSIIEVTHNWSFLPYRINYHSTLARKDYMAVIISFLGILALFAHAITIPIFPILPITFNQPIPRADAITLLIAATLLTIGHFFEFIEQGELHYTDRDTEKMYIKQQIENKENNDKHNSNNHNDYDVASQV